MKKFKFLSKLLAVLVIVPAIILCTACGGGQLAQQAKLEKKEFTQLNSVAEFQTKMDEITDKEIVNGYHMSFEAKMNMMGFADFEKFNMNMYYVPGETVETTKLAAKYDVKMNMDMEIPGMDPIESTAEMEGTMYVKDGYSYSAIKGSATANGETENIDEKTKAPFGLGEGMDFASMATDFADLESLLAQFQFEDMLDVEGVSFFVSTDGTQLKMVVDAFEEEGLKVSKYEMIFQFAEGKLTGFAIEAVMEVGVGDEVMPMEMKITVAPFEGEIDMPETFEGYTEETEEPGLGF